MKLKVIVFVLGRGYVSLCSVHIYRVIGRKCLAVSCNIAIIFIFATTSYREYSHKAKICISYYMEALLYRGLYAIIAKKLYFADDCIPCTVIECKKQLITSYIL